MLFKNQNTGEEVNVSNLTIKNDRIFFSVRGKGCGARFLNRNTCLVLDEHVEDGTYLKTAEGWEVIKKKKGEGAPKPKPQPTEKAEAVEVEEEEPCAENAHEAENVPTTDENANEQALIAALKNLRGGAVDIAKVRQIVTEELEKREGDARKRAADVVVKVVGKEQTGRVNSPHPLLKKVLALVVNDRVTGRYPWLFGPAGSGKSTLAKQVADALNLPFYSVSSLQQKYELEGYTDAVGKLVETVFYKAAKFGGVFLFDEASTTSGEVQVAFNSMLANLWYNFPKEGMINAHPDFHIIAADNTTGRGGNSTYSARFQMDASTLDRYTPISVDYTDEQDNNMAENDKDLVAFIRDLRKAITEARLTYTASPRALRAIKAHQKMDVFTELEAFELGLCSGWNVQDVRTLAARLHGTNKYYKMFNDIANR